MVIPSSPLLSLAAGTGTDDMAFELVPDFDQPNLHMRICRIRIFRIGEGMPCTQFANTEASERYSKSSESKLHNDYGRIDLGSVCPVNYPNGDAMANSFTAQVVAELPPESGYDEGM